MNAKEALSAKDEKIDELSQNLKVVMAQRTKMEGRVRELEAKIENEWIPEFNKECNRVKELEKEVEH